MQDQPLVSVIMPAYNAAKYIETAIQSVLDQSYQNWELLIVNDGSKDETAQIVKRFTDSRIRYFEQENQGVSAARNLGLKQMKGDFFCFLDADDAYPSKSIKSRIQCFSKNPELEFVDGTVIYKDEHLDKDLRIKKHSFQGNPFNHLIRLEDRCFFGNTWLIRVLPQKEYSFKVGMTHGEDLFFYITISKSGMYAAVDEPVLYYRANSTSAMTNLKGLQKGYARLFQEIRSIDGIKKGDLNYLRKRMIRIMVLSYLRRRQIINAIRVFFSYINL